MSNFIWRRSLRLFFIGLLLILLLWAPLEQARSEQRVQIDVPAVVHVESQAFTLGDVASIRGPREAEERLASLILSVTGKGFSREQVLQALETSGLEDLRIELRMPSRVAVISDGEEKALPQPQRRGGNRSLEDLVRSLGAWEGRVEVTHVGEIPPGELVEPVSIVPGAPAATLRFRDGQGQLRSLAVRMIWSQNVVVMARTVPAKVPIRPKDLLVRSMRINRPGVYAVSLDDVVGKVCRKLLPQGKPVPLELLSLPSAAGRGRTVRVLVRCGGLTASFKGVLLDEGAPGETVRVRRTDNRKVVLKARVIDADTVEVKIP